MQIRRGDTLIEVTFAIAVFAMVAIISINLMNAGFNTAQESLEVTMTRNEMDAQAEAIRFIHNAFTLERELVVENQQYRELWYKLSRDSDSGITALSGMANSPSVLPELAVNSCREIYDGGPKSIFNTNLTAFIMNTRMVDPEDQTFPGGTGQLDEIVVSTNVADAQSIFVETTLNPRVLFSDVSSIHGSGVSANNTDEVLSEDEGAEFRFVSRAEGIWIIAVRDYSDSSNSSTHINPTPEFFDFHIRSCWYGPGQDHPSTIGTIIRLYNPELVENI